MPRGNRPSLQQGLDREIFQIVQKFFENAGKTPLQVKPHHVLDHIRNSNSSLRRRPKRQLEDSIERVLLVLQEDESEDSDFAEIEDLQVPEEDGKSLDFMNRSIVSAWKTNDTEPTKTPKVTNGDQSKKRDATKGGERESKRVKRSANEQKISTTPPSSLSLSDLGGIDNVKEQLKNHLVVPLLEPEEYVERKIPIPRGILLHGPPGCGKTVISRAFAAELGVPFVEILGPSVVSGMSGESEKQIREHFERAKEVAPCLLFIDEIDVIAPKRDSAQSQMEKRIVAQLLISMDSLAMEGNDGKPVIVLAATNRPDSIDPALRRGGRFDTEINMGVPNETMRKQILESLTRAPRISAEVDFSVLAKRTAGFVGADLKDLVSKAGTWSMDKYREALEKQAADAEGEDMELDLGNQETVSAMDQSIRRLIRQVKNKNKTRPAGFEDTAITMEAFEAVLPSIVPSSKREGFATVPDVTWKDVGALAAVRDELQISIIEPIKNPERYHALGLSGPAGVLLWGPPGCGKTLLAKAAAAESKANFISVKGPELLNKYLGESERALRQLFARARSSIPCVIFFDELDAFVPKRSSDLHEASARLVNTFLTELDGLDSREGIYIIGATNRPDMIDEAMLRPKRLDTMLYVGLPQPAERVDILRTLIAQRGRIDPNLATLARNDECKDFSGADLESLLRVSGQIAIRRNAAKIEASDVLAAAKGLRPSVSELARYEVLREKFKKKAW